MFNRELILSSVSLDAQGTRHACTIPTLNSGFN
uniref:Uncharacterized protein n=1 Tax=Arundo donax TaxID=35708 RepID=A0A0A8ZFA0_ARUDO